MNVLFIYRYIKLKIMKICIVLFTIPLNPHGVSSKEMCIFKLVVDI